MLHLGPLAYDGPCYLQMDVILRPTVVKTPAVTAQAVDPHFRSSNSQQY